MSYQINKTDGTIVSTVADGQLDTFSTSVSLIGKNYNGFGEPLNENFIKLLENFADTARPNNPIRGQLWYDTSELKIKVYNGTEFVPVSSATISNSQPAGLGVGDFWFDEAKRQLFFFDGTSSILLAPAFSESQGLSGIRVDNVLDTVNQTRVITSLYNNGQLIGIFANDTFTPKNAIPGFSGELTPGFNASDLEGIRFDVTCSNSEALGGASASLYVRTDSSNIINGQLRIASDLGIVVGNKSQGNFLVDQDNAILFNSEPNKKLSFSVRKGTQLETAIDIDSNQRLVSIYPDVDDCSVVVGGQLTVNGDFTVKGTTTTINTSEVSIEDKSITLAKQTGFIPTDDNASPGGIILQGASSHVFLWSNLNQSATDSTPDALLEGYTDNLPALASQAWTSSEHINLAKNKHYAIDGVPVIEQTSDVEGSQTFRLSSAVKAIPGVTLIGKQQSIEVGPAGVAEGLRIDNNVISTLQTDQDLVISPNGQGNLVLQGSPKIEGLADPENSQDAATKEYVDNKVESKNIALSIDLSDNVSNTYIIAQILNNVAPPAEYRNGTIARILCTIKSNESAQIDINSGLATSSDEFALAAGGSASAITNVSGDTLTVPAQSTSIVRVIKQFHIVSGGWAKLGDDVTLPSL